MDEITKRQFHHESFDLSQDYDLLWELIQSGQRIPAWIVYSDKYEEPIWDLVEAKLYQDGNYTISSRGIGYEGKKGRVGFLMCCRMLSLHFILPKSTKK